MGLHPIHLNDTPVTDAHRAHVAHIAEVYRPRTEARRKCQEMREAQEAMADDLETRIPVCIPMPKYDAAGKVVTDKHGRVVFEDKPLRYVVVSLGGKQ